MYIALGSCDRAKLPTHVHEIIIIFILLKFNVARVENKFCALHIKICKEVRIL